MDIIVIIFLLYLYCLVVISILVSEGFIGKVFILWFSFVSFFRLFSVLRVYKLNMDVEMVFCGGGFMKLKFIRFLIFSDLSISMVLVRFVCWIFGIVCM